MQKWCISSLALQRCARDHPRLSFFVCSVFPLSRFPRICAPARYIRRGCNLMAASVFGRRTAHRGFVGWASDRMVRHSHLLGRRRVCRRWRNIRRNRLRLHRQHCGKGNFCAFVIRGPATCDARMGPFATAFRPCGVRRAVKDASRRAPQFHVPSTFTSSAHQSSSPVTKLTRDGGCDVVCSFDSCLRTLRTCTALVRCFGGVHLGCLTIIGRHAVATPAAFRRTDALGDADV